MLLDDEGRPSRLFLAARLGVIEVALAVASAGPIREPPPDQCY
jgi:hypothetical protein